MLTGSIDALVAAAATFVAAHFILANPPVRDILVRRLGERGFRALFSAVAALTLIWLAAAYNAAPARIVWQPSALLRWIAVLAMPFASVLIVGGVTTPGVTVVGGEKLAGTPAAVRGIHRVTRHPFLWGVVIWAAAHLAANGDLGGIALFGALGLLALGGMFSIDAKRRQSLGAAWGPIALTTSIVPFAAIFQRRARLSFAEIGWWRVALGLVLYAALLLGHDAIVGVAPIEGLPKIW